MGRFIDPPTTPTKGADTRGDLWADGKGRAAEGHWSDENERYQQPQPRGIHHYR